MAPRFEIVPEPVEERIQKGLTEQLHATLLTANTALSSISNGTNYALGATTAAFADHEFVHQISPAAIGLLSPRSLPGFLFACALSLRIIHTVLVSKMAHRAVAEQYAQSKSD